MASFARIAGFAIAVSSVACQDRNLAWDFIEGCDGEMVPAESPVEPTNQLAEFQVDNTIPLSEPYETATVGTLDVTLRGLAWSEAPWMTEGVRPRAECGSPVGTYSRQVTGEATLAGVELALDTASVEYWPDDDAFDLSFEIASVTDPALLDALDDAFEVVYPGSAVAEVRLSGRMLADSVVAPGGFVRMTVYGRDSAGQSIGHLLGRYDAE